MIDLDDLAPCGSCGGVLHETHHDEDQAADFLECWSYQCTVCGYEYGNNGECEKRLTLRYAPWTRALATEVHRLRAEIRAAELVMRTMDARRP